MGVTNFDIIQANQYIGLPSGGGGGGGEGGAVNETTGKKFYVNNSTGNLIEGAIGGSNQNSGTSPLEPFVDLDYAIGRCAANRGDMIFLMPGHAEDVTTQIDADVAGIKIIGLGGGDNRPSLKNSFTAGTSATLRIDADDIEVTGILFAAGDTANTVGNIEINTGADDVKIHDNYIEQGANDLQGITFLGACADVSIYNNRFIVTANGPDEAIVNVVGAQTRSSIYNNVFYGTSFANTWDDGTISSDQTDVACIISNNSFFNGPTTTYVINLNNTAGTYQVLNNAFYNVDAEYAILCRNGIAFRD